MIEYVASFVVWFCKLFVFYLFFSILITAAYVALELYDE